MGWLRQIACGLVLLCAATAAAGEDKNVYLSQARVFYQGLEFEKCLQRLDQAGRLPDTARDELAQIELYTGLCKFNLGKRAEAETNFKLALQLNPEITLPAATSPRIAEVFDPLAAQVKKSAPPKQVAAESPRATGPASRETASATSTSARSAPADAPRTVALEPSAAQRSNELEATAPETHGSKVLPITLAGTSVAAAGLAAAFGVMAKNHEAQANNTGTFYGDAQRIGSDARREATLSNVFIGVASAAAVGAVVTWIATE